MPDLPGDFTGGLINIETKLDEIVQLGINKCKEIYNEKNINYNKINTGAWVNVVRSKNPVQKKFYPDEKYHIHTDISDSMKQFIPNYTYVYYIQMPDVMNGEDGVIYFRGKNGNEYWIRPEEDDLIIMEGDMPHSPNNAPQSTIDRIVMAGNVGFEMIKKEPLSNIIADVSDDTVKFKGQEGDLDTAIDQSQDENEKIRQGMAQKQIQ